MRPLGTGAWCWFQDPRAVRVGDRTYAGWVTSGGDIVVGARDHDTGEGATALLHRNFERDDHDAPAFHVGEDLLAFYTRHNGPAIHYRRIAPETLAVGPERTVAPSTEHTYPDPRTIGGTLYLFYRNAAGSVAYVHRTETGWTEERELVTTGGREWCVYSKVSAATDGRVVLALTFAEGGNHDPHRDVRAVAFDGEELSTVGGRRLGGADDGVVFGETPVVYDSTGGHDAWVWDCTGGDRPELVYATFPDDDDHRYRYARYADGRWHDESLADAGTHIVGDNDERYYSGGVVLDEQPGRCYLSVGGHGGSELRRCDRTADGWTATTVARGEQNVRPVVPRNRHPELKLLWLRGSYGHYADGGYDTRVVGQH